MIKPLSITQRALRILLLAFVFFALGLAFFLLRMTTPVAQVPAPQPSVAYTTRPEPLPSLAHLPAPETYEHFTYNGEAERAVTGSCKDRTYVVLIFREDIDYRASPLDARYNIAYSCEGETFSSTIPLDTLSLELDKRYYVVKAHQGERGAWYDPY